MQKYILFLLFAVSFSQCMAQNYAWEDFVEDFLQQEDETMSEEERQSLLEDLSEIHQNPFEINNIKRKICSCFRSWTNGRWTASSVMCIDMVRFFL